MADIKHFSIESLTRDLQTEKPVWPLSSFGPAKCQPTLIADLDESPEEMRVKAAQAARAGNIQEYVRPLSPFFSASKDPMRTVTPPTRS